MLCAKQKLLSIIIIHVIAVILQAVLLGNGFLVTKLILIKMYNVMLLAFCVINVK